MRDRIVTQLIFGLLNDDEILVDALQTKFILYTLDGGEYSNDDLPLSELYRLFAEGCVQSLWIVDYPRYAESEFGEPLELVDDIVIFPQGVAHIEANTADIKI